MTKLNSTQSTLWLWPCTHWQQRRPHRQQRRPHRQQRRPHRQQRRPYLRQSTLLPICCRFRLSTKSTALNSTLLPVCTKLYAHYSEAWPRGIRHCSWSPWQTKTVVKKQWREKAIAHTLLLEHTVTILLLVCVSFTIIGQPRNSVLIRHSYNDKAVTSRDWLLTNTVHLPSLVYHLRQIYQYFLQQITFNICTAE